MKFFSLTKPSKQIRRLLKILMHFLGSKLSLTEEIRPFYSFKPPIQNKTLEPIRSQSGLYNKGYFKRGSLKRKQWKKN
jgi:hypothetical protein